MLRVFFAQKPIVGGDDVGVNMVAVSNIAKRIGNDWPLCFLRQGDKFVDKYHLVFRFTPDVRSTYQNACLALLTKVDDLFIEGHLLFCAGDVFDEVGLLGRLGRLVVVP